MAMKTSESAAVGGVYVKLMTGTVKVEFLIFMEWNFKINLGHKPLPLESSSILTKIYAVVGKEWYEAF